MDLERLQKIIDWMRASPLQELEIADGDFKAHLVRGKGTDDPEVIEEQSSTGLEIVAPSFGMVHLSPTPDAAPFVTLGSRVDAGQTLCVIEAMKVFSPIETDRAGTITAILVPGGSEVSAGQPIFRLD